MGYDISTLNYCVSGGWITIYLDGIWGAVSQTDWGPTAGVTNGVPGTVQGTPGRRDWGSYSYAYGTWYYVRIQMNVNGADFDLHYRYHHEAGAYPTIFTYANGYPYMNTKFGDDPQFAIAAPNLLITPSAPKTGVYLIRNEALNAFLTPAKDFVSHGAPVDGLPQILPPTTLQEWLLEDPDKNWELTLRPVDAELAKDVVVTADQAVFINKTTATRLDIRKVDDGNYTIQPVGAPLDAPTLFSLVNVGDQVKLVDKVSENSIWAFKFLRPLDALN